MFKVLFLLFLVVPIVEISILIQLSQVIGGWTTVLLVIFTAYFGARMVKQQGLTTLEQIKQKSATGQIPGEELFSGVCILISGVLLLTPGILTDILGFSLLTPAIRKLMIKELKKKVHLFAANPNQAQGFTFTQFTTQDFSHHEQDSVNDPYRYGQFEQDRPKVEQDLEGHNVIDGEFKRKD